MLCTGNLFLSVLRLSYFFRTLGGRMAGFRSRLHLQIFTRINLLLLKISTARKIKGHHCFCLTHFRNELFSFSFCPILRGAAFILRLVNEKPKSPLNTNRHIITQFPDLRAIVLFHVPHYKKLRRERGNVVLNLNDR